MAANRGEVPWQSQMDTPEKRLDSLCLSPRLADLVLLFPGTTTTMQAHRLVLAMSSPVFEEKFYGSEEAQSTLTLPHDPPEAFKWILKYIYSGTTTFSGSQEAISVCHLAYKYKMNSLINICSQYLCTHLAPATFPCVCDCAVTYQNSKMIEKCLKYFHEHTSVILSSRNFESLSRKALCCLLKQGMKMEPQVKYFNALVLWGRAQTKDEETADKWLRQIIQEFLPYVNFLEISVDDFVRHVVPSGVLTSEESCAILLNIKMISGVPMPDLTAAASTFTVKEHIQQITISIKRNEICRETSNDYKNTLFSLEVAKPTYVVRLQFHSNPFNLGHSRVVSFQDGFGEEVGSAEVHGNMAKFPEPLLLLPKTEYEVIASINNNLNICLGDTSTSNNEDLFTIYYWNRFDEEFKWEKCAGVVSMLDWKYCCHPFVPTKDK